MTITDLRMATSFLLRVCEGQKLDHVWLVDTLLDQRRMKKFSGTDRAGENHDLVGKTCDAFAHFCLTDSKMEFVPVDIQGKYFEQLEPSHIIYSILFRH